MNFESPQILTDLYRDLRDRRLLPLVLVLLIAIAVVPIALSSKSTTPLPVPPPPAPVAQRSNAPAAQVEVSNPGVRDFRRRLAGSSENPFGPALQESAASASTASGGGSSSSGSGTSGTGTSGSGTAGAGTTGSTGGGTGTTGGGSPSQPQTGTKYYTFHIKVRAGQVGKVKPIDDVAPVDPLPSKKVPAASFLGVTTNGALQAKTAVLLVSAAVSTVDGDGTCTYAGSFCQLVQLKPGEHEDFVWTDGNIYRIELVKFELIARNNPPTTGGGSGGGGGGGAAGRAAARRTARSPLHQRFSF